MYSIKRLLIKLKHVNERVNISRTYKKEKKTTTKKTQQKTRLLLNQKSTVCPTLCTKIIIKSYYKNY